NSKDDRRDVLRRGEHYSLVARGTLEKPIVEGVMAYAPPTCRNADSICATISVISSICSGERVLGQSFCNNNRSVCASCKNSLGDPNANWLARATRAPSSALPAASNFSFNWTRYRYRSSLL